MKQGGACLSQGACPPQNISNTEAQLSTLGGAALLLLGLSRGKLCGLLSTIAGGSLLYRGLTRHCHLYEALGINTAPTNPATAVPARQGVKVERSTVINGSASDLYAFWRDFENMPRIMPHVRQVEIINQNRSHWQAVGPLGRTVEWDAELITDREPEVISWRSLPGGGLSTAGSVRFESLGGDRGTAVTVSVKYDPPAGKAGATVASLLGYGLKRELEETLDRFKTQMESGAIPMTGKPIQGAPPA
jgi:uncharacterized membrane protein